MLRRHLVELIVQAILGFERDHPIRVAFDGIDAAGKTILADEVADALNDKQRTVIRASVDGFHRPKKERHLRGEFSPEGYYMDSFDHTAIKEYLLQPLGSDGTGTYRTSVFDFRSDSPLLPPLKSAPDDAVLLFDGVFLLRPELRAHWDIRVFLHIDFDTSLRRALGRDLRLFGSKKSLVERYEKRYIPGQKIYLRQARPERLADLVIDNNDPNRPVLIRTSIQL
ncbi:MAG: uridine kinase [candidate division WOR-3 bacterium]|nr:MAG: uridine kinase [candidate division WOR-3 bacterium]